MAQLQRIEREFAKFHKGVKGLSKHGYQLQEEIENGYVISALRGEPILLTLMALTHGDELAGLAVLNEVVEFLQAGFPLPRGGLALLLGNYPAALQGKRYLQRDLNRCFDTPHDSADTGEIGRAREITTILKRTRFFIDFHQTTAPSASSFGIFPFQHKSLAFAQLVNQGQPIVTRIDGRFSQDGMCSDEFVQEQGNIAITIELGQKGFDYSQIACGVLIAMRALRFVNSSATLENKEISVPLYTSAQVITFPPDGDLQLVEGLYNLKKIARGECVAQRGETTVVAENDGVILFPKYTFDQHQPPNEICHVLRKITPYDLPNS